MGCSPSSLNQIRTDYNFTSNDVFYLTESWNIIKTHDPQKFAHDVLIRTSNQSSSSRQYWRSKIQVDGNNYDYGEHDSCLRSDSSWQVGLRDYSVSFISIFDQFVSIVNDENRFLTQIRSLATSDTIFLIENEPLSILKKCMREVLDERFQTMNCDSTDDYQRVWEKFLTFIIDHLIKQKNTTQVPSVMIISATT